ncbi:helix-turn-helix domain-containing protein [Fulvivirgaceae bacterium PWU5]|uniref:Helix-turn-helix domain-containing protein n=1 Tax=Dawidia cretensis TaxID=2782350 RepID=A0AAP2DZZ7_9BACT|nr:helix-turn-helix transcriptional regulator [Dawidia cretensis]MBT1710511.1 helix-turn-helix domain-containing protein [Dawidia cretensis]
MASEKEEPIHHGRNLKRFREMVGVKQESLAEQLGPGWSQKRISLLEGKELIDDPTLREVSFKLKVSPEIIRLFSERVARECVLQSFEQRPEGPVVAPSAASAPSDTVTNASLRSFLDHCMAMAHENKRLYEELLRCERMRSAALEMLVSGSRDTPLAGV